MYLKPVADDAVEKPLRELFDQDLKEDGYIHNYDRVWAYRPEMAVLWKEMTKAVRSKVRLRVYELVTIAAAREIGCVL